ncbi:MAG TPA: hypothetical protein VHZ50_18875, partial [Puia sp.]|nr:hypothetical protein [Puia sp.]
MSKYIFSLVHRPKQPKNHEIRSNRHRPKIASNADQSRISKNYIYSKRDTIDMRKLIMKMSVTVDGFVGNLNGGNEWIFK